MAKKTVNFDKLSLPERPILIKKDDDPQLMEQAVERIHPAEKTANKAPQKKAVASKATAIKTQAKNVVAPKTTTQTRRQTTSEPEEDATVKKISMDLPVNIYTYLKMRSFQQATTMREFVVGLLREEMRRKPL